MEYPETMSDTEMQGYFEGGPQVKTAVLVLVGERIYKRENGAWRLLENGSPESVSG